MNGNPLHLVNRWWKGLGYQELVILVVMLMILAAVGGSWLGAGIVAGLPRRQIQIGMGLALLGAATFMALGALRLVPAGGDALALTNLRLVAGLAGNFVLGALMTLGIGLYAPCMILVSLLERRVVVLGDEGIDAKVGAEHWKDVDQAILDGIRRGSLRDGLIEGIRRSGAVLAEHFPWRAGDRNELPDRLIVRKE